MSVENDAATAASTVVEKSAQSLSASNQDVTTTEDGASGTSATQQPAFTSPSSVPLIPSQRSTGEAFSGPLSFPGTVPALTASANPRQEADVKRFKGS